MLVTGGRYRHRSRGTARLCARRSARLRPPGATQPRAWGQSQRRSQRSPRRHHRKRLSRSVRAVRLFVRLHPTDLLCRGCLDLGTATDYPSGEASGLTRTVVGWSVPAPDRRRLERGRVRRPQREPVQPRQALGGAGEGDAGLVGRAACSLRRRISPDRQCRHQPASGLGRHQPASGLGARADLVWRARRSDLPALRKIWRRLHAVRLSRG